MSTSTHETFFDAYIAAALWSSTDDNDEPLDHAYGIGDIDAATLATMRADCERFAREQAEWITDEHLKYGPVASREHEGMYGAVERAGHDFWLTRNGHGCGFWDGDWNEPAATHLTAAAHAFGEFNLYVGDDGQVYGTR